MTMLFPNPCYNKVFYRWDCTVHEGGKSTHLLNFIQYDSIKDLL